MGISSIEQHLADVRRAQELAHASSMVTKFEHTLARKYAAEHPNDPVVHGYEAAKSNLDALTDGGIVRGHMRLLNAITDPEIGADS